MPDLKPNEKTFWDAAFLAALQGIMANPRMMNGNYEYSLHEEDRAYLAQKQATEATLARRKVWEEVK